MELSIVPVGHIKSGLLEPLKGYLESMGFSVTISDELPVPEKAYNKKRNQYVVYPFIDLVAHLEGYHLIVTDVDLYIPRKNFIFGYGPCPNAIISIARLKGDLLIERMIKEAVHELGHVFSLYHCSDPLCVMYFSNSLQDTDRKRKEFCKKCKKLWLAR